MSLVQGAAGFCVFASSVYNYIAGMKVNDIIVGEKEVGDASVKLVTSHVSNHRRMCVVASAVMLVDACCELLCYSDSNGKYVTYYGLQHSRLAK